MTRSDDDMRAIISDDEVERVHAHANFGPGIAKRDVLADTILKFVCGFTSGSTATRIVVEHGLATLKRNPMKVPTVTAKGRKYLWAALGRDRI